jgi:demethylspheroidene O-methyltransferase
LLDHSDEHALGILRRVRAALPPGGTLLIAEPLAGLSGTEPIADAYFGLYLWAMGRGRARSAEEHQKMLATAGFSRSRVVGTRYPVWASVIIATA